MSDSTPETYLIFVSQDEIRLKWHRIWLEHIVPYFQQGLIDEEVVATFPTLTLDEVAGVRAWYDAHRAEADEYVARSDAALADEYERSRQEPVPPVVARIRKLRDVLHEQGRQQAAQDAAEHSQA
jgi:uncharacterized protein (DUF433 family)